MKNTHIRIRFDSEVLKAANPCFSGISGLYKRVCRTRQTLVVEMMGVEPMSEIRSNRLLRVQTVDELFPFPRSPLSGVGSGSFMNLCHGLPSKLWKVDISLNL